MDGSRTGTGLPDGEMGRFISDCARLLPVPLTSAPRGEIVRTHIMRPTWHFVAGEDIRWMLMLSGKRVRLANESFGRRFGISEAQYCRCNDLIGDMLRGGKSMTCREIGSSLEKAGIPDASQLVRLFLLRAESDGIICSGPDRDRQPTFALFDERVPPG